jgi:hypothetical protein
MGRTVAKLLDRRFFSDMDTTVAEVLQDADKSHEATLTLPLEQGGDRQLTSILDAAPSIRDGRLFMTRVRRAQ